MDLYLLAFVLGVAGLVVMAAGGLGHRGGGHAGPGHAGHGHTGHAHAARGHGARGGRVAHGQRDAAGAGRDLLLALASPRVVFAVLLGLGAAGLLLRPVLHGGVLLAAAAVALGVAFERAAVAPVWRFTERFASAPAQTLETALYDHARAASGFDARGEGLVALEVDGQVVQLLGRLRPEDRARRVRAGDRLRVEEVDAERHRCTVSAAGPA
ncbi:hypothetical protein tb265_18370 [Gemmatimonadetes bacterium T265]|nr:hypothetical protein tb265_18370 [Gemmatimonadetes bacterium T265]